MLQLHDITISTNRLRLRALHTGDADALHAYYSSPDVMRYWSRMPTTSLSETRDYVASRMDSDPPRSLQWVVEIGGRVAGTVDLFRWRDHMMELGYLIGPEHQGNGYAFEAVTAALDFGFTHLNLHRVEAQLHPDNEASSRLLEKLGFRREGHLRRNYCIDGVYSDTLIYGLLASDRKS